MSVACFLLSSSCLRVVPVVTSAYLTAVYTLTVTALGAAAGRTRVGMSVVGPRVGRGSLQFSLRCV